MLYPIFIHRSTQNMHSCVSCCHVIFGYSDTKDLDLNAVLPIKMGNTSFNENDIFSAEKVVGSALELSTKSFSYRRRTE